MGWSWWNPCCWIGYCDEKPKLFSDKWGLTNEFINETCSILTLIIVLRILAKLEYMFPVVQNRVTDDSVGTGDERIDNDVRPRPPPPTPAPSGWIPTGAAIVQDLILHQLRRGDEAPAGIGPLQVETVMRILDLSYKVELDATTDVFFTDGPELILSGSRPCLDFVRRAALEETGRDWDISPEMEVPAHFLLVLLRGEFPAMVTLYQRRLWRNGQEFQRSQLTDPYELNLAGKMSKREMMAEIEMSLKALDVSLGDKQFLVGDQLTAVDGLAFGILAQMNWTSNHDLLTVVQKFPRLVTATNILRERLWSDWNPPADDLEIVQIFPRPSQPEEQSSQHSSSPETRRIPTVKFKSYKRPPPIP